MDVNSHGLVSLARCAELLTLAGDKIERSALSRYCDAHALKGPKVGREVLVDFERVAAHRRENYTRQVMSGHEVAPPSAAVAPQAAVPEFLAGAAATNPNVVAIPARDDPARDLKAAQLRQVLRDEAIEEGRLTDTAEVDAGVADAIVDMRAAFAEVRADIAERGAAELGLPPEKVRVLRALLKRYDRVGQDRFATRVAKALQAANETGSDAHRRLTELTAHAMRLRARRNPAFLEARA